jgi:hypothetical protein
VTEKCIFVYRRDGDWGDWGGAHEQQWSVRNELWS